MSDDTIGVWHDPEVEVRIVAMVLGEASEFERAELRRMIAEDRGLKQFYEEMCALHGTLQLAHGEDDAAEWKLSEARREVVLEALGKPTPAVEKVVVQGQRGTRAQQWRSVAGIAACLVVTFVLMEVVLNPSDVREKKAPEIVSFNVSEQEMIEDFSEDPFGGEIEIRGNVMDKPSAPSSRSEAVIAASAPQAQHVPLPELSVAEAPMVFGETADFGMDDAFADEAPAQPEPRKMRAIGLISGGNRSGDFAITKHKSVEENKEARQSLYKAEGYANLGKLNEAKLEYERALRVDRDSKDAREGLKKIAEADSDGFKAKYDQARSELLMEVDEAWELGKDVDACVDGVSALGAKKPKVEPTVREEISAAEQTHSTFSLNVSDASYQLARVAMLERGEMPAAESVRSEEFINAFDYGDPKPSMAQKVACAHEQAVHPFLQQRNLLRISMSTAAQGRANPLNLVVLLDNSGSMERPDRAETAVRVVEELAQQLGANDSVSLMSFARDTRLLVDRLAGDRAGALVEVVRKRPSEGGTNLERALQVAQSHLLAQQKDGVQSRIVVLTDGAANLGNANPESLMAMVEQMRGAGVSLDACGIGFDGLDDGILEALTRKGDGRYYVLDKPEDVDAEFGKQIAGALRPAAKNVKVQVVFNPERVGKYRLLGFEQHRLAQEDFRNDAVDAAELAAEESGTALYQIEAKADGEGAVGTVFVRFQDLATGQMVERSWTIPYESAVKRLEQSGASMQLAAVAGLLGEKLHQSDGGSTDFGQLGAVLGELKLHFSENAAVQDLLKMVEVLGRE